MLLISNSSAPGEEFLQNSISQIEELLHGVSSLCFVPHAAVTISMDEYYKKICTRLSHINIRVESLHLSSSPIETLKNTEVICVGGGNTFALIHRLQQMGCVETIRKCVERGTPYIGWSAGSNIAAPKISTTNDMPIVEPRSFDALNLIPFQINPHYTDSTIEGHGGESREDRIREFIEMNRDIYVTGVREGSMLKILGDNIELMGKNTMRLFKYGQSPKEFAPQDDINFLIKNR
ncbi:MAG: dipeptidase PepE [Rikenellaceae bacterium]